MTKPQSKRAARIASLHCQLIGYETKHTLLTEQLRQIEDKISQCKFDLNKELEGVR